MKELTTTFNNLLQDKRVRSEQSKYEAITRQRSSVMSKYRKIYQEFLDLEAGLEAAKKWYNEMKDTVNSLEQNVETFVNNRRSEGAQLLNHIEHDRATNAGGQADRERERLRSLMERMSMDPSASASPSSSQPLSGRPQQSSVSPSAHYPSTNFAGQYQVPASQSPHQAQMSYPTYSAVQPGSYYSQQNPPRPDSYNQGSRSALQLQGSYDPSSYPRRDQSQPTSPPPNQQQFTPTQYGYQQPPSHPPQAPGQQHFVPAGYVPPPPPPGPPPLGPQQTFPQPGASTYSQAQMGYTPSTGQPRGGQPPDPWADLGAWK